jgi:hypothetical protein
MEFYLRFSSQCLRDSVVQKGIANRCRFLMQEVYYRWTLKRLCWVFCKVVKGSIKVGYGLDEVVNWTR